jgi:hypothetical protein
MSDEVRPIPQERSLGELFTELTRELSTLVRQEISLARTEMGHKAGKVGRDVGFLAAGGAVAYAGLLAIVAAIIIGIAQLGVPWWLSAFIVGAAIAGAGYVLVQKGISALKTEDLAPRETVESVKEDAKWIRERATH